MFKRIFAMFFVMSILFTVSVSATIDVAKKRGTDGVYVAGNADFYPIEYFDSDTGKFEGIMPRVLERISKENGIKFVYIHDENKTPSQLVETEQIEMVSAYIVGSAENYRKDVSTVFVYEIDGTEYNIGFAFTPLADEELIATVKNTVENIKDDEIHGYFVQDSSAPEDNLSAFSIVCIILILLLVFFTPLFHYIKKLHKNLEKSQLTESDTGIGNLSFFEREFERVTSYNRNSEYYVAYIICDSNFFKTLQSELIFADTVKNTSLILKETAPGFVAKITESGYAMVFKAEDQKKAEVLILDVMKRLNDSVGKSENYFAFYSAVYNLRKEDYSSETVIFNLRRNCSEIIGSDVQMVFCDAYDMNSVVEEKKLIESFKRGIEKREFKVHLQFIVDNKTKEIISAEALSRWEHPEKGLLTPFFYIEKMTSVGLISEHDYYMFEMVCRQLHKWHQTEMGHIRISCNFTRITLSEPDFIDRIKEIISRYVFDVGKVIIEITEDVVEKNVDNAMKNVVECKKLGIGIALDDMGSGYTSFANLCDYPIDIVKIDRNILLKTENERGKALIEGMIALSKGLGKKVVCEGVETEEHNAYISSTGCDMVQGWYFSKVIPAKGSEKFYTEYTEKLKGTGR